MCASKRSPGEVCRDQRLDALGLVNFSQKITGWPCKFLEMEYNIIKFNLFTPDGWTG